ncbi:MAG: site-2 protease family protein [Anaerolinea sp.]|nr:site-2 protease family protein [Anaerolinea sp.]
MLNETASSTEDRPALRSSVRHIPSENNAQRDELRQIVMSVLVIERDVTPNDDRQVNESLLPLGIDGRLSASFEGRLLFDSEEAYDKLDKVLKPMNMLALFREENGKHVIHVVSGRVHAGERSATVNILLAIATFFSVLLVGASIAVGEIDRTDPALAQQVYENLLINLWRGLPYALSIMLILGAHELGHYFAARHHKVAVTLPYFIPAPFISLFGTYGAFIQLREPMRNRKVLLDVGASGPLFGLLFAIPIVFIGLATSPVAPPEPGGMLEGNSLLYALAKTMVFGRFLPDGQVDVTINQLATAGWVGLLITGLNLLPIGQLDGGHILYSLIGNRARWLYYPIIVALIILTLRFTEAWLLWLALLFLFGRMYAAPLDMITKLDPRRQFIAVLSMVVFAVTVVPIPFTFLSEGGNNLQTQGVMLTLGLVVGLRAFQNFRLRGRRR